MGAAAFALVSPEPDEHELQIQCSDMLRIVLRPDVQWTAIDHAHSLDRRPARGARPDRHGRVVTIGMLEAIKRKRRGIKPGISDYLFWRLSRGFALELKVGDGILTGDESEWLRGMIRAGCETKVCWTKDQVFNTVCRWGLTRVAAMP